MHPVGERGQNPRRLEVPEKTTNQVLQEVLGATSAALDLISTAIAIIQAIRKARARVSGSSKFLVEVSSQIDSVQENLELVRGEPRLQSPSVIQQINQILAVSKDLDDFFKRLQEMQEKSKMRNMIHALTSGDKDDEELQGILARLNHAQAELHLRISTVHVGITGNLGDGFEVAFKVVQDTNEQVRKVLRLNLQLAEQLRNREMELVGVFSNSHQTQMAANILKDLILGCLRTQMSKCWTWVPLRLRPTPALILSP